MSHSKPPLWVDHWELSSDMVNCKECHAGQPMAHREFAFAHEAWCSRQGLGQFPYLELLEVVTISLR